MRCWLTLFVFSFFFTLCYFYLLMLSELLSHVPHFHCGILYNHFSLLFKWMRQAPTSEKGNYVSSISFFSVIIISFNHQFAFSNRKLFHFFCCFWFLFLLYQSINDSFQTPEENALNYQRFHWIKFDFYLFFTLN